jgi:hypothetical protein
MSITIVKATQAVTVKNLIVTIYSNPGIGKTTAAFTADKPLLLDFDNGIIRAAKRGDAVQITKWGDVSGLAEEELTPYNTIVIDVAGRLLEVMSDHLIKTNPKYGKSDGSLSLQGFGALATTFKTFITKLRGFGKDIILLAHAKESADGDTTIYRIDAMGSAKQEITKISDLLGYLYMVNNKRTLCFNPTDSYLGKNCAGLPAITIPDIKDSGNYLADIIKTAKETLNNKSDAQVQLEKDFNAALEAIDKAATPIECTNLTTNKVIGANIALKQQLMKRATELGYTYSKEDKMFIAPVVENIENAADDYFAEVENVK